MRKSAFIAAVLFLLVSPTIFGEFQPDTSSEIQLDVAKAIIAVKKSDPGIQKFFDGQGQDA